MNFRLNDAAVIFDIVGKNMIGLAAPKHREGLEREARERFGPL